MGYRDEFRDLIGLSQAPQVRQAFNSRLMPAVLMVKRAQDQIVDINQAAMEIKSAQALRRAGEFQAITALAYLGTVPANLAITMWLTAHLLRSLAVLGQALHRIGGGNFENRVRLAGHDEITQLAERANEMASRLLEYRRHSLGALLLAQQASQSAINNLPDPVLVLELEGLLVNLNQAAQELLLTRLPSPQESAWGPSWTSV
ncbi:hypothetical protein DFAR_3210006 [Desulfarculales bacterium]